MSDENPKLDKRALSKISSLAHDRFLERGYSEGQRYLDQKEAMARAYAEATLIVLNTLGYKVAKQDVSNK